jgi:hypothetical protein
VYGFIDHLYAIADLHTTALLRLFQFAVSSPSVSWQRLLTVEILQLHGLRSSCHSLSFRAQLNCRPSTNWMSPIVFFITPRRGPHRKCHSSIVSRVFVSAGTCSPSHCPETAVCLFVCCISRAVPVVEKVRRKETSRKTKT